MYSVLFDCNVPGFLLRTAHVKRQRNHVSSCARDAKGLVLFGPFGRKNRSGAEPGAARPQGAPKRKLTETYVFVKNVIE